MSRTSCGELGFKVKVQTRELRSRSEMYVDLKGSYHLGPGEGRCRAVLTGSRYSCTPSQANIGGKLPVCSPNSPRIVIVLSHYVGFLTNQSSLTHHFMAFEMLMSS